MDQKERVEKIKSEFRLYMDGTTARSLRRKGCHHLVVWGVSLGHLKEIAEEYTMDYDLALGLWDEDVRECKLLATMLMDRKRMDIETARRWMTQAKDEEMAEMLVFNLVQHLSFAGMLAREWSMAEESIICMSGFNLYGRLFMNGLRLNNQEKGEFLTQAVSQLSKESVSLRRAAMNAIVRFSEMDESSFQLAREATMGEGYDFL